MDIAVAGDKRIVEKDNEKVNCAGDTDCCS